MEPTAIDPWGCACTECIIGRYVPLHSATKDQLMLMMAEKLDNHTGFRLEEFDVKVSVEITLPSSGLVWK